MKGFLKIVDLQEYNYKKIINVKQIVCIDEETLSIRFSDGSVIHTSYDDMCLVINTIGKKGIKYD